MPNDQGLPANAADQNPSYWQEYSNLQRVKHDLIRNYLNGWFPKLGTWSGKILYFDTHAGRGRYAESQLGSPLVALQALLQHSFRNRLLEKCEANFTFIERDATNLSQLEDEIKNLGSLPTNVKVTPIAADCFDFLQQLTDGFKDPSRRIAPAFFFLDPYGFKIPGEVLQNLMKMERVELFVNLIWRELDMAIAQPDRFGTTLDLVFGDPSWRSEITSTDFDTRADQAVGLFRKMTQAKWATYIRMLGDNNATRYLLMHLTNHDAGRDLMKECIWKACPNGGYYARKNDDPAQQFLITPTPDLLPLRSWLEAKLKIMPMKWQDLLFDLRAEIWREPHLNEIIRLMRREGRIEPMPGTYSGKFVPKSNPMLRLI